MTYLGFYEENKLKEIVQKDPRSNRFRYNFTKTISIKKFISEFGASFSPLVKEKLLQLELRSVLTRLENINVFNIKHVEHTKHTREDESGTTEKEYVFGQLVSIEGKLYFSKDFTEDEIFEKCPSIDAVYESLEGDELLLESGIKVKFIGDDNVESFINGLLTCIPDVSERYVKILKEMTSYSR
jgi:hypothetical protein